MTTLEESTVNEISERLPSEFTQDIPLTNPQMMTDAVMGIHKDKAPNLSESTTKQEDVYHYYKLWRKYKSVRIAPNQNIEFEYYNTHNEFLKTFGNFGAVGRTGKRFVLEFRIQIFSSSTQQGAIMISTIPFNEYVLGEFYRDFHWGSRPGLTDTTFLMQYNTKIVPLGQDTEIYVELPFDCIYPFLIPGMKMFDEYRLNSLVITTFDTLKVVETAVNTCDVVIWVRCKEIEFVGSQWSTADSMGDLVHELPK